MMKTIEFKVFSYSGKDKANEDYASCLKLSDTCLVAVLADGMGENTVPFLLQKIIRMIVL